MSWREHELLKVSDFISLVSAVSGLHSERTFSDSRAVKGKVQVKLQQILREVVT